MLHQNPGWNQIGLILWLCQRPSAKEVPELSGQILSNQSAYNLGKIGEVYWENGGQSGGIPGGNSGQGL